MSAPGINFNNAKLTVIQVQNVRDLARCGFTARSLAGAFDVCQRSITNLLKGRQWWHIPDEPRPLPVFSAPVAAKLRVSRGRITAEQRKSLEQYKRQLTAHIEEQAEREGNAASLLTHWTARNRYEPKRSKYEYLLSDNTSQANDPAPTEPTTERAGGSGVPANASANDRLPTGSDDGSSQNLSKVESTGTHG